MMSDKHFVVVLYSPQATSGGTAPILASNCGMSHAKAHQHYCDPRKTLSMAWSDTRKTDGVNTDPGVTCRSGLGDRTLIRLEPGHCLYVAIA